MNLGSLIQFCVLILLEEDDDDNMEDDEQLAKAIQESLKPDSPPRNNYGNVFPPLPYSYAGGYRYMKRNSYYNV